MQITSLPAHHALEMDRLGDEIAELSAHLDAATAPLLTLLRVFDARGGWNTGFRSCPAWLSWRVGLDLGAARERVRVARALGTLPLFAQALARGELSYAKVRALTRVATPETEARLLAVGRAGTASHVERIVRGWRCLDRRAEARETARRHASRGLQVFHDEDGMVILRGRLEPEVGALLVQALAAARETISQRRKAQADATEDQPTPVQQRADALALLAETALHHGMDPGPSGERYQVVVHVDTQALAEEAPQDQSGREGGGDVSAETSRDLTGRFLAVPGQPFQSAPGDGAPVSAETFRGLADGAGQSLAEPGQPCQSVLEEDTPVSAETSRGLQYEASRVSARPDQPGESIVEGGRHVSAETSPRLIGGPSQPPAGDSDTRVSAETSRRLAYRASLGSPDADQPGQSVLEDGTRVSAETSRRLACDASRVVMRYEGGRLMEVGARTRTIPPALRRALLHRDRGCRFPGCGGRFAEGHHLRHWAHGGPTTLSNLALLCRRHHRAVHEEGYEVARGPDGALRFRRPDGRPLPEVPVPATVPQDPVATLRAGHDSQGLRIHARTACAGWLGERVNVGWAIDVLHPWAQKATHCPSPCSAT